MVEWHKTFNSVLLYVSFISTTVPGSLVVLTVGLTHFWSEPLVDIRETTVFGTWANRHASAPIHHHVISMSHYMVSCTALTVKTGCNIIFPGKAVCFFEAPCLNLWLSIRHFVMNVNVLLFYWYFKVFSTDQRQLVDFVVQAPMTIKIFISIQFFRHRELCTFGNGILMYILSFCKLCTVCILFSFLL